MGMTDPDVYDHFRPTEVDVPEGTYRVVGTSEAITLLRVGDADGRRVHTGEVVTVDREALDGFEPAENPTDDRSIGAILTSVPRTFYWQLRAFGSSMATNPVPSTLFALALLVGVLTPRALSTAGPLFDGLAITGAIGLAAVGSGRL
ncbi:MAG: hypothetical protein V5A34_02100 [Halapricum sp.]